ncbi:MAG: hypothetical protein KDA88_18355 [Planctomycetaceae bacterium]|nr:hypothetical protein [Planctomycetaceae bacterium]MCB9949374.1 hypothetical protein [Planctomycetaceae bacterium]
MPNRSVTVFHDTYPLCQTLLLLLLLAPTGFADDKAPPEAKQPAVADSAGSDSPPDISSFPKLNGTLTEFVGHSIGYIPPRKGMPVVLDLAELSRPFADLQHDPKTKQRAGSIEFGVQRDDDQNFEHYGYIPIPGPLVPEDIHYYDNGEFESGRFVAKTEGTADSFHRVTVDVNRHPGNGPNGPTVRVWIVIETGNRTRGVAVIDCEIEGEFPSQKPDEERR